MKNLLTLFLILLSLTVSAQGIYKNSDGEVSFLSEAPIENIQAYNKQFSSLLNTGTKEIVFDIPIRNFNFAKLLMQVHFNEKYMESDKYPDATFKGKINEDIDFTKDGEYKATATGIMTIHGIEKTVTDSGTFNVEKGNISLRSKFSLALKDYNITVPKLVVKNIAEVIPVRLNADYLPFKKEETGNSAK